MEIEGAGFEAGLEIARLESGVPSNGSESGSALAQRQLWSSAGCPWRDGSKSATNVNQMCAKCVPNMC